MPKPIFKLIKQYSCENIVIEANKFGIQSHNHREISAKLS